MSKKIKEKIYKLKDHIIPFEPFIIKKQSKEFNDYKIDLLQIYDYSSNDLCIYQDKYIIRQETIRKTLINPSLYDEVYIIINDNNILLAIVIISINEQDITIEFICNNIKYRGNQYGKNLLKFIFNNFKDLLLSGEKIIKISPARPSLVDYYANKFKKPNYPIISDNKDDIDENITELTNGYLLYGNKDIILQYLLQTFNEFIKKCKLYNISIENIEKMDLLSLKREYRQKIKFFDIDDKDIEELSEIKEELLESLDNIDRTPIEISQIENYNATIGGRKRNIIKSKKILFNFSKDKSAIISTKYFKKII